MPTLQDYERNFRERSPFLNPLPPDSHRVPKSSQYGLPGPKNLEGSRQEFWRITTKDLDTNGDPKGYLPFARLMLKEAKEDFDDFKKRTNLPVKMAPFGDWLDKINIWSAKVSVFEEEARLLSSRIRKLEKDKEAEDAKNARRLARRNPLSGRIDDGKLVEMAGRKVVRNKKDQDVFADDGELVDEYIERVRKERLKKFRRENQ